MPDAKQSRSQGITRTFCYWSLRWLKPFAQSLIEHFHITGFAWVRQSLQFEPMIEAQVLDWSTKDFAGWCFETLLSEWLVPIHGAFSAWGRSVIWLLCLQFYTGCWILFLASVAVCFYELGREIYQIRMGKRTGLHDWPPFERLVPTAGITLCSLCLTILPLELFETSSDEGLTFAVSVVMALCKIQFFGLMGVGGCVILKCRERCVYKLSPARYSGKRRTCPKSRRKKGMSIKMLFLVAQILSAEAITVSERIGSSIHDDRPGQLFSQPCGTCPNSADYDYQTEGFADLRPLPHGPSVKSAAPPRCRANSTAFVDTLTRRLDAEDASFDSHFDGLSTHDDHTSEECHKLDHDSHILTQVPAPVPDLIGTYILRACEGREICRVTTWFHPIERIGVLQQVMRETIYSDAFPAGPSYRGVWADWLGRQTGYLFSVQPLPIGDYGTTPNVIVTPMQGEHLIPTLIDIRQDQAFFRGTFVFTVRRFLTAFQIFAQVQPGLDCTWTADCSAETRHTWYMIVPLIEGQYLRLRVVYRDEEMTTTCSGYNSASILNSESDTSDSAIIADLGGTFYQEENEAAGGRQTEGSGGSHPSATLQTDSTPNSDESEASSTMQLIYQRQRFQPTRPFHGSCLLSLQRDDLLRQYYYDNVVVTPPDTQMSQVWVLPEINQLADIPITLFRGTDRRQMSVQASAVWRGHDGVGIGQAILCHPRPRKLGSIQVPTHHLLLAPLYVDRPGTTGLLLDVYAEYSANSPPQERVALLARQTTVRGLLRMMGYSQYNEAILVYKDQMREIRFGTDETVDLPSGSYVHLYLAAPKDQCSTGSQVLPEDVALFQLSHPYQSYNNLASAQRRNTLSRTRFHQMHHALSEIHYHQDTRGTWPKIWFHNVGYEQPMIYDHGDYLPLNPSDLTSLFRYVLRDYYAADQRIDLGYIDMQPTPSQSGDDRAIHILVTLSGWVVKVPTLIVWQYDDVAPQVQWHAVMAPRLVTQGDCFDLIGERFLCTMNGVQCHTLHQGADQIRDVPVSIRAWQRIDAGYQFQVQYSCNEEIDQQEMGQPGENSATPRTLHSPLSPADLTERDDTLTLMQTTASMRQVEDFGRAAERGMPFYKVLWISRRMVTDIWMNEGRDVGFEHFRMPTPGIWEKQVRGWQILHYEQLIGEPFAVQLRRTGLWATQLLDPFESEGFLRIGFITVFPQPIMDGISGGPRSASDTVVLAVTEEVLASDALPLVVLHHLSGERQLVAIQCTPSCFPNHLCSLLGYDERCSPPNEAVVYFRHDDVQRTFSGIERIGLPPAAHVQLGIKIAEACEDDTPGAYPLREHETLILPSIEPARQELQTEPSEQLENGLSLMQTQWALEMEADEQSFLRAAEELVNAGQAGVRVYPNMIRICNEGMDQADPLRQYLQELYSVEGTPIFTVHVWAIRHDVAAFARITPMHQMKSFTQALLRDWDDFADMQPWWVYAADPPVSPTSLRLVPADLIMITQQQKDQYDKVYLVDILYTGLPKRVAILSQAEDQVIDLLRKMGLREVCTTGRHTCLLQSSLAPMRQWDLLDHIDEPHGTSLFLHFRAKRTDECQPERTMLLRTDGVLQPSHTGPRDDGDHEDPSSGTGFYSMMQTEISVAYVWYHEQAEVDSFATQVRRYAKGHSSRSHYWTDQLDPAEASLTEVTPAPVHLGMRRPTFILYSTAVQQRIPLLIELNSDERRWLGTILYPAAYPPYSAQMLFDRVDPQHECQGNARCWGTTNGQEFRYHHDIELMPGQYIQFWELTHTEDSRTTSACSDSLVESGNSPISDDEELQRGDSELGEDGSEGTIEDPDTTNLMQSWHRLHPDDGRTPGSLTRLSYCTQHRVSWLVPMRLDQARMYLVWKSSGRDPVAEHFIRQGLRLPLLSITGWMFQTHEQDFGSPFTWNFAPDTPWAQQTAQLLRGTRLIDALLYTVIPQPTEYSLQSSHPRSLQILIPAEISDQDYTIFVVEHCLKPPTVQMGIRCIMPCSVRKLFQMIQLGEWCDQRHRCVVTFQHGVCRKDFFDDDLIDAPFASKLSLNVLHIPELPCQSFAAVTHAELMARQVANLLHEAGSTNHRRAQRQAMEVLQHTVEDDASNDFTSLMQRFDPDGGSQEELNQASVTTPTEGTPVISSSDSVRFLPPGTPNFDFDWMHTIVQARRYVTEYGLGPRRPGIADQLVMLLAHSEGVTRVVVAYCPLTILRSDVAISHFERWLQEYTFCLDPSISRIFPVITELYQNLPTLIVARSLPNAMVPIVVHIRLRPPTFWVYLARSREPIVTIQRWIQAQMEIPAHAMTYNGARVDYRHRIDPVAGDVLEVRPISLEEYMNPEPSTTDSGPSLTLNSHNTWTSEPGPGGVAVQGYVTGAQTLDLDHELRPIPRQRANEPDDYDLTGLLQLTTIGAGKVTCCPAALGSDSMEDGYKLWKPEPTRSLRPPGNVVYWLGKNVEAMDNYLHLAGHDYVVDATYCPLSHENSTLPAMERSQPVKIELAQILPAPEFDNYGKNATEQQRDIQFQIQLPDFGRLIDQLFQPRIQPEIEWEHVRSYLTEECIPDLDHVLWYETGLLTHVEIYCDGSYMPQTCRSAAWAFAAFGSQTDGRKLLCCHCGLVETDPLSCGWVGASESSARSGEATALIRAIEWSFCLAKDVPYTIYYDATSIGEGASGQFGFQREDAMLVLLRSLSLALDAFLPIPVSWQHVKAHTGDFGNELADALAKTAIGQQLEDDTHVDYVPYLMGKRKPIETLWWHFEAISHNGQYPELEGCCQMLPPLARSQNPELDWVKHIDKQDDGVHRYKKLQLSAITYNVSSLQQNKGSYFVSYLRTQADTCEYDIVFLQETRSKQSQLTTSQSHFRLSAAAENGKGGSEIWLLRNRQSDGRKIFAKEHVRVLHASSEVLVVRALFHSIPLLLFSAHAPHSGSPPDKIRAFWDDLIAVLNQWMPTSTYLIGGIDANGHFEVASLPHVGSHGLEAKSNLSGECLLKLLRKFDIMLPSTFEEIHTGNTATWTSNVSGAQARCDYFLVPCSWQNADIATSPHAGFDAGTQGFDHTPLMMQVRFFHDVVRSQTNHDRFDRRRLQCASRQELLPLFRDPPVIPWHLDVDSHATRLSAWVRQKLAEHFPVQGNRPRKSYITDATWQIRTGRLEQRRLLRELRQKSAHLSQKMGWEVLRGKILFCQKTLLMSCLRLLIHISTVRAQSAQSTRDLGKALRRDRTQALEKLGEMSKTMNQQELAGELRAWGIQSRKKPSHVAPLPLVKGHDGMPLETFQAVAEHWRRYFAEQEDGIPLSVDEYVTMGTETQHAALVNPAWDDLPTRLEVEAAFRRTNRRRAYFIDGVPGDLLAAIPDCLTSAYFPLLYKQASYQTEALLHKGGRLVAAFKKGDATLCRNYRSLFVSSVIGKTLHSIYRSELGQVFEQERLPMQIGGLKGQTITQANHTLQLFHRAAIHAQESVFFLFIDVQNAFYRLIRQHFTTTANDARSAEQLFQQLRLPRSALSEFIDLLNRPPALETSDASPFLRSIFAEFYRATWFTVDGSSTVTATRRGSRPGDSFADVCFGFTLAKIMKEVEETLSERFPCLAISWSGKLSPFPSVVPGGELGPLMPVWADDIALAAKHRQASTLLELLPDITTVALDRLALAGLQPNMQQGKTEVMVDFRGPGSVAVRRTIAAQDHLIQLPTDRITEPLRLVGTYKHLGTVLQRGAALAKDVQIKFACAHDVFTRYRPQLFGNRQMKLTIKVQFFHSLILSTIIFNSATWLPQTKKQQNQVHNGFQKLYKRLAVAHFGREAIEWTTMKVLAELSLPDPDVLLRNARLRYWMQVVRTGQAHFWAMIQTEQRWFAQLQDDFRWLQTRCPEETIPQLYPETWDEICAWAFQAVRHWKSVVHRAVCRAIAQQKRQYQWENWHKQALEDLIDHQMIPTELVPCETDRYYCLGCRVTFQGPAALAVHGFKKHARLNVARYFVQGLRCEACLKVYASELHTINHVKRNTKCLQFYKGKPLLQQIGPGVNSRAVNQAWEALPDPVFVGEGPKELIPADIDDWEPAVQPEVDRLHQAWNSAPLTLVGLKEATQSTWLYPDELRRAYQAWQTQTETNESLTLKELQTLTLFGSKLSYHWLTDQLTSEKPQTTEAMRFFQKHAESCEAFAYQIHRQPRYKPGVFAHLFSGHRRQDDFQSCTEKAHSIAISIDIIFHIELGDMARPQTFALIARAMKEGIILGWLAGPPCETWSKARGQILEDGRPGPRVLRSLAEPHGMSFLNKREDEQTTTGSLLLGVAARLLIVALRTGCSAILEHPGEDENTWNSVSIWRLAFFRFLLKFPRCRKVRVLQGHYGAYAVKPTDFLLVNISPTAEERLVKGRTTALPKFAAIGLGEDKQWRTTRLKEYPRALCHTLAEISLASQPIPANGLPIPTWFTEITHALCAEFDVDAAMGKDFCDKGRGPHN